MNHKECSCHVCMLTGFLTDAGHEPLPRKVLGEALAAHYQKNFRDAVAGVGKDFSRFAEAIREVTGAGKPEKTPLAKAVGVNHAIEIPGNLHGLSVLLPGEKLTPINPFTGWQVPPSGSRWKHTNGNEYVVEFITNEKTKNPDKYPASVVYRNASNGTLWSRALDDWYRSMTEIPTDFAAPEENQAAEIPEDGSRWTQIDGSEYVVEDVIKTRSVPPITTVLYRCVNDDVLLTRTLDLWHTLMTKVPDSPAAQEDTQEAEIPEVGSRWYYKGRRAGPVTVLQADGKGVTYQPEASEWSYRNGLHLWHESFTREPLSHVEPVDDAVEAPMEGQDFAIPEVGSHWAYRGRLSDPVEVLESGTSEVTYAYVATKQIHRIPLHQWVVCFIPSEPDPAPAEGTYWTRQSNKRVYEVRGHADDHVWCVEVGQETGLWFPIGNWHERFLRVADSFLERALSSSSKFPEPGYERLHAVFRDAHDQAAIGKGDERHANNLPFDEQRMQTISQGLGSPDGMAYQVIKKIQEGLQMNDHARTRAELLGALNYLAGIVIFLDDKQHAAEQHEAGHDLP